MSSESEDDEKGWNEPILTTDTQCVQHSSNKRHDTPWTSFSTSHHRTIVHIDVDCFYAQVEMIRNPMLRDKPLGIQQKYIIVTCNYVARKYGVTKLMAIREAKEKCPSLVIVNGEDLTHYREMSYEITSVLQRYNKSVERLGFDENFIDVTELVKMPQWQGKDISDMKDSHVFSSSIEDCVCGCASRIKTGAYIAFEMRRVLHEELGITSCAGVAHNKLLAKLVGETYKPNQQTYLFPCHIEEIMASLSKVRKIPGIGHATCKRLAEVGIETIPQLQNAPTDVLEDIFGAKLSKSMKELCFGIDNSPVVSSGPPQSISDEDSFAAAKCSSMRDVKFNISKLLDALLKRLENDGRRPHTLRLTIRRLGEGDKYLNRESRQCPVPDGVFRSRLMAKKFNEEDHEKLMSTCMGLFSKMVVVEKPFCLTLINICFTKFSELTSAQGSIAAFLQKAGDKMVGETASGTSPKMQVDKSKIAIQSQQKPKSSTLMERFFKRKSDSSEPVPSEIRDENANKTRISSAVGCPDRKKMKISENDVKPNIDMDVFSQLPREIQRDIESNLEKYPKGSGKSTGANTSPGTVRSRVMQRDESTLDSSFLPPDTDVDVFKSLPPDIQKEIIESEKSKRASPKRTNVGASKVKNKHSLYNYFKKM